MAKHHNSPLFLQLVTLFVNTHDSQVCSALYWKRGRQISYTNTFLKGPLKSKGKGVSSWKKNLKFTYNAGLSGTRKTSCKCEVNEIQIIEPHSTAYKFPYYIFQCLNSTLALCLSILYTNCLCHFKLPVMKPTKIQVHNLSTQMVENLWREVSIYCIAV